MAVVRSSYSKKWNNFVHVNLCRGHFNVSISTSRVGSCSASGGLWLKYTVVRIEFELR